MDIIYLLLPVALIIVTIIIAIFYWAVRSDQFDDLEGPAHRILMDEQDDTQLNDTQQNAAQGSKASSTEDNKL